MPLLTPRRRVNAPFLWRAHDGLNRDGKLVARSFDSEVDGTFTRTGQKYVADANGRLTLAPYGVPAFVGARKELLTERATTNLCIRSQEFDTWTDSGSPCAVSANAIVAPDDTLTADLLTPTTTASYRFRSVTFTADGEKSWSLFVKAGTSVRSAFTVYDITAAASRHVVGIVWTAGVPTLSTLSGAGTLYPVVALANGWYRVMFSATGIIAANNNAGLFYPENTGAGTGTAYAWGAQAENNRFCSSYIPTTSATAFSAADRLTFPVDAVTRDFTFLVDGTPYGMANRADNNYSEATFLSWGGSTSTDWRLQFRGNAGTSHRRPQACLLPATGGGSQSVADVPGSATLGFGTPRCIFCVQFRKVDGGLRAMDSYYDGVRVAGSGVWNTGGIIGPVTSWAVPELRIGRYTDSNDAGFAFGAVAIQYDHRTTAEMLELAGITP